MLCLGDIVGYSYHYSEWLDGRDPNACVEMVREHCDLVLCGNHDLNAVRKLPSGFRELGMPEDWYNMDLGQRTEATGDRFWIYDDEIDDPVNENNANFLSGLPEEFILTDRPFNIYASHFIYPDLTGNRQSSPSRQEDFREHLRLIKRKKCRLGLAGHAHLEGYAQITRKALGMNYFRKAELLKRTQLIVSPAITRSKARSGYLILDTEKYKFESVPLD